MPASLESNGEAVPPDVVFEWVNTGLWRGTADDVVWLERLTGQDTLAAGFAALKAGRAEALPGGGMEVTVNGLAGWRYTLERRESLAAGEWLPVPGQPPIPCEVSGPLSLAENEVFPRMFYRVIATPP